MLRGQYVHLARVDECRAHLRLLRQRSRGGCLTPDSFNCGTGGTNVGGSLTATEFKCKFPDGGAAPTISVTVKDDDGASGSDSHAVTVTNVADDHELHGNKLPTGPLVYVASTFTTIFSDPGADTWRANFTWSDGSPLTDLVTPFVSGQTVMHTFATAGCGKTQRVRVTDDDGGYDERTTTVNVGTGGFLPPMTNQPVTNKLKNGQVLPVKIQISDCGGAAVNGLTPAIRLLQGDQTTTFDDAEIPITPPSVSSADTNGYMRASGGGSYIYNMSVNVQLNTDYTVVIYP